MLTFNGLKFAKNAAEFIESLFEQSGTCHGFYKITSRGIRLYDHRHTIRAFIPHNMPLIVSCIQLEKGLRYSYALSSLDEKWLGLVDMSFSEECALIEATQQSIKQV